MICDIGGSWDYPFGLLVGDVPDSADPVAGDVARLLVVLPEVKRLAIIGPLHAAVLARGMGIFSFRLGVRSGHQWWPFRCTGIVAVGRARRILVECVERHALGVGEI